MSEQLREITLFDTRSDKKRPFTPQEPGKVRMYVCGVTVYDLTHIGHARVFVFFDVVQRFLRHLGYDVCYVRNHTDVDDKILKRAKEQGIDPLELSAKFIDELDRDMSRLGLDSPTFEPKVSEHIDDIIEMVQTLVDDGYAYESEGDVYYRVQSFDGYGKLSRRKLEDMEAGRSGRVEESDKKEHPFDFALWKSSTEEQLGWDSPWGRGRPGWHIECSAMSMKYLGESLDIHGGGRDLIFPHHENEIAQSEAASGTDPFANFWMHVGMVNVAEKTEDGDVIERKMSKSLGNFWTTRDVLQGYHPDAIRYFMHTACYRNQITYAIENLEEATHRVEYLYTTIHRLDEALERAGFDAGLEEDGGNPPEETKFVPGLEELVGEFMDRFDEVMANDINTPRGLAVIAELARAACEATQTKDTLGGYWPYTLLRMRQNLTDAGSILGILQRDPQVALKELRELRIEALELDPEEIDEKVAAREQARAEKDWAQADKLRDELDAMGVEIMDSPEGTTWRVK